jgi:hypothetical protein
MKHKTYTKQGLWSLFLICAFPFHLWTLILVFRDVSWITERTNSWDALGVASYGLLFALVESILFFLFFVLVGFVTPRQWKVDKRVAFLGLLFLILALWAMISQLLFIWNINLPVATMQFLASSGHPLRWLYAGSLAIVIPTVAIPIYFFLKTDKAFSAMQELMERLSLLTMLYLFFDFVGVIIIVIRNI